MPDPAPSPEKQVEFLHKVQRLLNEGDFVATYKFALLLAIAEVCIDQATAGGGATLMIRTRDLAEKFIGLYWRHAAPYPVPGGSPVVLTQNTDKQAAVVNALVERRRAYGSLAKLRADKAAWSRLVTTVNNTIKTMPLWKLQTVGGRSDDFLYPNEGKGSQITLRPGIAYCFRTYYWLIGDLVRGVWVRYLQRQNRSHLGNQHDLHSFLWGSERSDLSAFGDVLNERQAGMCFYCERKLGRSFQVDHFIPWVRYPVDLGHNFVLAHDDCNNGKSDHLAAEEHLERWVGFTEAFGDALAVEFTDRGILHDLHASRRGAAWAYEQVAGVGAEVWLRGGRSNPVLTPLTGTWRGLLGEQS